MKIKTLYIALLLFALPLMGADCSSGWGNALSGSESDSSNNEASNFSGPLALSSIGRWAYQIQNLSAAGQVDALVESRYDMVVVDPTRTDWSSGDKNFDTIDMVNRLKNSAASDGTHRKLVIAYINIGEAENWRWYWTWSQEWTNGDAPPEDWPGYILAQDPDGWGGNYPVAYWDSSWKEIVIYGVTSEASYNSILDEVLNAGFDGVYLDWVEGFENSSVMAEADKQKVLPGQEMINFIKEIKEYARKRSSDFVVIQQNGADLVNQGTGLLATIDAIAQEEVWYGGAATDSWSDPAGYDSAVSATLTSEYISLLAQYSGSVPVFNVEYALNNSDDAYEKSASNGFVPYVTRRSLSELTTTPPPGY
ncbi:hypothetical protein MNBD_NITROSPINAE02-1117 [hydrothermal vent metagenome]|uniref:Glycoside-hydrolase family GH114 TIM-barrel domain-containing protein n=1 Tax=hydrothermal vent metagenome TaxID=652676 RepID=A0A3B1CZB2_9ZZZZ